MIETKVLRVTEIGEYIRYHSCQRRFKLKFNNYQSAKNIPFFELIFQTSLDPVLEESGRSSEQKWAESLTQSGLIPLTSNHSEQKPEAVSWYDFTRSLNSLSSPQLAYGREIEIQGTIGNFELYGQIDFILVLWENGQPKLRLVECKASRKDRTYHRI